MASTRAPQLRRWLTNSVAETLGLAPEDIDSAALLTSVGLSSIEGITLARRLGEWLGRELPSTLVWDHPSIDRMVEALASAEAEADASGGARGPSPAAQVGQSTGAGAAGSEPIVACVGLSCRFPGAPTTEAYWQLLLDGGHGIREVPPERWDVDAFYSPDPKRPGKIASRYGGFLDAVDEFDPGFFEMTPREARVLDPRQRQVLEATWDALEDAGIAPRSLAGSRTGVFMATLTGNFGATLFNTYLRAVDGYAGSGSGESVVANRVSHVLGLCGPSICIDTACSGSLVATHLACESLRRGECDLAIVGGVNSILRPDDSVFFSKTGALAPDGRCKPFDARANGIVRSEGVGVVVLRRLDDALAAGDRVRAELLGSAVNHGGATNGIMAPSARGQEQVLRAALARAGLDAAALDYVETHGTGTPIGDPIEASALGRVYGRAAGRERPLLLASVKGNIGHTEAAAGVAGLIKAVLGVERRTLPASAAFEQPNPLIDFEGLGLEVVRARRSWPAGSARPTAGVSAFGFSGANAHVIVAAHTSTSPALAERYPEQPEPQLILISGRSRAQLDAHAAAHGERLATLEHDADVPLAAYAAATALHREHHEHRLALVVASKSAAREALAGFERGRPDPSAVELGPAAASRARRARVAFVFSGQGAHWPGMARELIAREPVVRRVIRQCERIAAELDGPRLSLIDGGEARPGSQVEQLELFAVQVAIAALLRQWGLVPDAVVGQSLGELAAAHVAGALSLDDAVAIVARRAACMASIAGRGATGVVGLSPDEVRERLTDAPALDLAGVSGPRTCAVSGPADAVERWLAARADEGVFARRIPGIEVAFHGRQLEPLLPGFRAALADVRPRPPRVPVYAGVRSFSGARIGPADGARLDLDYWARNLREPFDLPPALAAMRDDELDVLIEIGPAPVLQQALRACVQGRGSSAVFASCEREADAHACLQRTLARAHVHGATIDWRARYAEPVPDLELPRTSFQRARHWFDQLDLAQVPSGFDWASKKPWLGTRGDDGHPLVGTALTVAGGGERVWSRQLRADGPAWLGDHRVGGQVLVPAAAMLAMAAEAGRELLGRGTVAVEDFDIEGPIVVPADASVEVQATARRGRGASWTWELHVRELVGGPAGEPRWRRRARARLSPGPESDGGGRPDSGSPTPRSIAAGAREVDVDEHFALLAADGLDYGPAFRTPRTIALGPEARPPRVDLELEIDADARADLDAYALHPTLLDGAIQATRHLHGPPSADDPARLPVGFERVIVHADGPSPSRVYARLGADAQISAEAELRASLTLESDSGELLMSVEGLRLRPLVAAPGHARPRSPAQLAFALAWRAAAPACAGPGFDPREGPSAPAFLAELDGELARWSAELELERYAGQWPTLEALATTYVVRALGALGWRPRVGELVAGDELAAGLGVAPRHHRLLGRLLQMLGDDGILARVEGSGDSARWEVRRALPEADADPLIATMEGQFPASAAELGLVRRLGPALAEILRAEQEAVELLFGDFGDEGEALLRRLYRDAPIMQVYNRCAAELVAAMASAGPDADADRPLRVVEVGAGTGATTWHLLQRLPARGVDYLVSDLSPLLVEQTRAGLGDDPRVRGGVLDVERSPSAQGFAPGSAHVVVAANVLHATRDLGESLAHVRELLAPGGLLVVVEGNGPQRWLDLIVGGTEGWWRFSDDRREHPLLDRAGWRRVLDAAGFEQVVVHVAPGETSQVVISARAPVASARAWLILDEGRGVGAGLEAALVARGDRVSRLVDAGPGRLGLAGSGDADAGEDAAELMASVLAAEPAAGVVHLRALALPETLAASEAASLDRVEDELMLLRDLARALAQAEGARLWVATAGVHHVEAEPRPIAPLRAPIWGLVRSLFVEQERGAGALIDLDPRAEPAEAVTRLLTELGPAGADEDQIAWREDQRFVARLVRAPALVERGAGAPQLGFDPEASYLVTGGTRGIGLAAARWLVERGVRRLVLLARTALPPRSQWDSLEPALAERAAAVRELESRGAAVRLLAVDLGDERALAAAIERLDAEGWPPLGGLIHSAGLIDDQLLVNLERPALERVLRPKLRGPWWLARSFAELDLFVLFSSGTSLVGGTLGQANYAAGNAFLDALARDRAQRGLGATAINWGVWGGSGIIARSQLREQLARTGLRAISEAEGLACLELGIRGGAAQIGFVAIEFARWAAAAPGLAAQPFYAEVVAADGLDDSDEHGQAGTATAAERGQSLAGLSGPALRARLHDELRAMVAEVTMSEPEAIDPAAPLHAAGLDSIMAVELKHRIDDAFPSSISVVELLRGASVEGLAEHIAAALGAGGPEPRGLRPRPATALRPASSVQLGFWSVQQRSPDSPVYSLPFQIELAIDIDGEVLARVADELVRRHPILRTALELVDGKLVQRVVEPSPPVTVAIVDLSALEPEQAEVWLGREIRSWARGVFDLAAPPLLRCATFRLPGRSVCLFNVHHAALDGWSASILVHEFERLYPAFAAGQPSPLPSPRLSYADYVEWQLERLASGELDEQLSYWRTKLARPRPALLAPITPAAARGFPGRQQGVALEAEAVAGLEAVAREAGATMFMVLLAALSAVLHRTHGAGQAGSGASELTVGAARSNRDDAELRGVLGCFVNVLPLHIHVDGDDDFASLVARVRDETIETVAHCDAPFEHALRAAGADLAFEIVFVFKTTPTWLPDVVTGVSQLDNGACKFPLSLDLTREGAVIEGFIEYDTGRFTGEEARDLAGLLAAFSRAAARAPRRSLAAIFAELGRDAQSVRPLQESIRNDANERFGF